MTSSVGSHDDAFLVVGPFRDNLKPLLGGSPLLQQGELDLPAAGRLQSSVNGLVLDSGFSPGISPPRR